MQARFWEAVEGLPGTLSQSGTDFLQKLVDFLGRIGWVPLRERKHPLRCHAVTLEQEAREAGDPEPSHQESCTGSELRARV